MHWVALPQRHMDDKRFERELKHKEVLQKQADQGASKESEQAPSATYDAFMRMQTGQETRTISDKINDPNRVSWEQFRKVCVCVCSCACCICGSAVPVSVSVSVSSYWVSYLSVCLPVCLPVWLCVSFVCACACFFLRAVAKKTLVKFRRPLLVHPPQHQILAFLNKTSHNVITDDCCFTGGLSRAWVLASHIRPVTLLCLCLLSVAPPPPLSRPPCLFHGHV